MALNIIYPKDNWILQDLAEALLKRIPDSEGFNYKDKTTFSEGGPLYTGKGINYYINYYVFRNKTPRKDVVFFTHPEPDGKFLKVAQAADFCICMNRKYRDFLLKNGIEKCDYVMPGIDLDFFKPRLVLGFIGRRYKNKRKGDELLDKVASLGYVDLKLTNGKLRKEQLIDFYSSIDYVLVTSKYEGGPMCLLEGAACGKKIICPSDVGFASEIMDAIIPYWNSDWTSLKSTIDSLLEIKMQTRSVVENYTYDNFAKKHINIFKTLERTI